MLVLRETQSIYRDIGPRNCEVTKELLVKEVLSKIGLAATVSSN
jgi:hypothetical protein